MKYLVLLLAITISSITVNAQDYWQQDVAYTIKVSLNDKQHSLKGDLSLEYTNNSPDTLGFIWFHLWPNAYKDSTTALAKQLAADKPTGKKASANNTPRKSNHRYTLFCKAAFLFFPFGT